METMSLALVAILNFNIKCLLLSYLTFVDACLRCACVRSSSYAVSCVASCDAGQRCDDVLEQTIKNKQP